LAYISTHGCAPEPVDAEDTIDADLGRIAEVEDSLDEPQLCRANGEVVLPIGSLASYAAIFYTQTSNEM
jgi:hypothetical protein